MNWKLKLLLIALITSNIVSAYLTLRYRNAVIGKNLAYHGTKSLPVYKNPNREFRLLQSNQSFFENSVVFIGSSMIQRWDFGLFFKDEPYINRGVNGNTSENIFRRFQDDALSLHPGKVVVYFSTNDLKYGLDPDQTKRNSLRIIKMCRESHVDILVLSPLPVCYKKNHSLRLTHPAEKIRKLVKNLKETCINEGVYFLNLYKLFTHSKNLNIQELFIKDGLHLNIEGYRLITAAVEDALRNH